MSKTNTFENDIMLLIFNNTTITDIGDAGGILKSVADGSLYVGLTTADPTETGSFTSEATFGSYARQAVARTSGGWTVTNNQVQNAAAITFPEATSGSETVTHWFIADSLTTGTMLYHGALDTSRAVSTGVTVEFAANAITITED